jgi:hypothetical protein
MAKAARMTGPPPCPMVRCGQERAGERIGFIIPASIGFKNFLVRKNRAALPHENSNNLLAVEPESENDARRLNFYCEIFLLRPKRRLPATKRIVI